MIVGLKRRKESKSFYDLGLVHSIRWEKHETKWERPPNPCHEYNWTRYEMVVRSFETHRRGFRGRNLTNGITLYAEHLAEKICDEEQPHLCKNDECKFKFRCVTSNVCSDEGYVWRKL